jgi:16S rRNA (guanine527-N7)-methyltransferase
MESVTLRELSMDQQDLLERYRLLLLEHNQRVNLIARTTDPGDVEERHIRHSLSIAVRGFASGSTVVDFGSGGGLPGLPLAVVFPDVRFVLVDSTRKKMHAAGEIIDELGLANVTAWWGRAEQWEGSAQYAVSRATAPLLDLWRWYERVEAPPVRDPGEGDWEPGILCLKGGDLSEEIRRLEKARPGLKIRRYELRPLLASSYFDEKVLLHVHRPDRGPAAP